MPGSTNLRAVAQPDYVPIVSTDQVRPSNRLQVPGRWEQDRPAEIVSLRQPVGRRFGSTGSDLGFGLKLANLVAERAVLSRGRAPRRRGRRLLQLRVPAVFDFPPLAGHLRHGMGLRAVGLPAGAPEDLVAYRRPIFAGAGHDYYRQRAIADMVTEQALLLPVAEVRDGLATHWRKWTGATGRLPSSRARPKT